MASDEENSSPPAPSYTERILAAIDALDGKNGSNKSAISEYIESEYEDLPAGHLPLLSHYLNKMKESGDLVIVNGNYMRPNPDTPRKRGRGRPAKPKLPLTSGAVASPPTSPTSGTVASPPTSPTTGTVVSPPRSRGRPPKPKDPLAVASAKAASGMPKRRGRPPKRVLPDGAVAAAVSPGGVKRGRGRPPKVKPQLAAVGII